MKELAERVQAQYKAEKQKRKEVELKLSNLDEELQDLKSEKESLERVRVFKMRSHVPYISTGVILHISVCVC